MSELYLLYYIALTATTATSIMMALLLWLKGGRHPGLWPLIFFCLGVGSWVAGHLLINTGNPVLAELGRIFVNMSPLAAAFFVHFTFAFTERSNKTAIFFVYIVSIIITIFAVTFSAGELRPWLDFQLFYQYDKKAVIVALITACYSAFGHFWLLKQSFKEEPKKRKQITAAFLAGVWGLAATSGFAFGFFGLTIFPYPVLLLPFYTLILVYGILRYEFMDINLWARKSLAWGIVVSLLLIAISLTVSLLIHLGFAELNAVPLYQIWLFSFISLIFALLLQRPASELATRLIYPGSKITGEIIKQWQNKLHEAQSYQELSSIAAKLLSGHLKEPIEIAVDNMPSKAPLVLNRFSIRCNRTETGWNNTFFGWSEASPGIIHTTEVFGALLTSSTAHLEKAIKLAEKEKQLLKEKHLSELGRLSAMVAHELRNPFNIISMASAECRSDIKSEISIQMERAQKLINDLLTYSGKLKIEKKKINLQEQIEYVISHYPDKNVDIKIEVPSDIYIFADPHRFHQIFFNLLDNAYYVLKDKTGGQIMIQAVREYGKVKILTCDNGPGVPDNMVGELFQPFSSGREGGSGLGLAIVQHIMEAHGGIIKFGKMKNWSCAFELHFPLENEDGEIS